MNIITQLEGASVTGEMREPRGILTTLHAEPRPGCHVKLQLGSAGLFVRRGDLVVVYPLAVILRHVEATLPPLVNPAAPSAAIVAAAKADAVKVP